MGKSLNHRDERTTCGPAPSSILLLIGKDLNHLMFDPSEEPFGVYPVHVVRVSADSVESNELGFDKAAKSVLGVIAVPEEEGVFPLKKLPWLIVC